MSKDNLGMANRYADSLVIQINNNSLKWLNEAVMTEQRDWFAAKALDEALKAQRRKYALWGGAVALLLLLGCGVIVHRYRMRTRDIVLESKLMDISRLSREVDDKSTLNATLSQRIVRKEKEFKQLRDFSRNEVSSLRAEIDELRQLRDADIIKYNNHEREMLEIFRHSWDMLNKLGNMYFEKADSPLTRQSLITDIEREIAAMKTPQKLKAVEDSVNRYLDNIVSRLRVQCPFLKPEDITLLMLTLAGLSPRMICLLTGLQLKNYYTKKRRLIARIAASDAVDKNKFVERLG